MVNMNKVTDFQPCNGEYRSREKNYRLQKKGSAGLKPSPGKKANKQSKTLAYSFSQRKTRRDHCDSVGLIKASTLFLRHFFLNVVSFCKNIVRISFLLQYS